MPNAPTPRVMVTHPGIPLTDLPVDHRPERVSDPLTIPGVPLADLVLPFVHIFDINFNLIGQFPSYSAAIMALSPVLTAGLTSKQAEVKSRGLQRVCN